MIAKIDINSIEFKNELENTKKFTKDVLEKHNLVFNPDFEVVESIEMGLTRNQLIYGKKYCPCFMVIKESETEKNRVCPCVPALTKEIPTKGNCHCGIFCTKDKADEFLIVIDTKEAIVTHSRGLTKNECEDLLNKEDISSIELEALLEARELGMVDFLLVDTREWMEWVNARIEGTDYLVPTTSFISILLLFVYSTFTFCKVSYIIYSVKNIVCIINREMGIGNLSHSAKYNLSEHFPFPLFNNCKKVALSTYTSS